MTANSAFGTMHRHCCRPVPRLIWNSIEFHFNRGTCRQQYRFIAPNAVYAVKNAPEDGRICRPKHVGLI